jgi:malonate-semialdehyde dehydrogenase (acetylating)/methylmalonate-semialdehyde dehydrogenase
LFLDGREAVVEGCEEDYFVGTNVGNPVPLTFFPFSGHKRSFFGDLDCLGRDGAKFYTQVKTFTTKWVSPEEAGEQDKVSTWEGTINREL